MRPVAVFCFSISICALSAFAQWAKTRQQQGKQALNSACVYVCVCLKYVFIYVCVCVSRIAAKVSGLLNFRVLF